MALKYGNKCLFKESVQNRNIPNFLAAHTHNCGTLQKKTKHMVVIGNSWTAAGVAQLGIQSGHNVTLVNISKNSKSGWFRPKISEGVKTTAQKIYKHQSAAEKRFLSESMNRLQLASCPQESLQTADITIEAIAEGNIYRKLLIKRQLLKAWSAKAPSDTTFAFAKPTDQSYVNSHVNKLAVMTTLLYNRKSVIGINFFKPVPVVKLAEVVRIQGTSDNTLKKTISWVKEMEVTPVVVNKSGDMNLSLIKLKNLIHKVEQGRMSLSDVDLVTKLGSVKHIILYILAKVSLKLATLVQLFMISTTNFSKSPMGPFEMADFIGLDKAKKIIDEIHMNAEVKGGDKYKESQLLNLLISEGKLGRQSGEGFYLYHQLPPNKILVVDKSRETYM